jgi:Putative adhesin
MKTKMTVACKLIASVAVLLVCLQALPAAASAEGSFQRTLTVTGPANVDLSTGSGSVHVRTGGSGQVEISAHIKVTNWLGGDGERKVQEIEKNPPIQQSGNDIRIGHSDDSELFHNVSISYELVVPAETQLRSHTGSGGQTIEGLQREVEIETGSGGLKISDMGNTVRAETGSGDVEIRGVKGNVRVKTGSGSIHAEDIGGGFDGQTGSGHIVLEQTAPGAVRAETGSGGMELRGVKGSLEATAGSGTITAEGDPTGAWMVHSGSGGIHLKLGSGAAFDLDAHTSSGSISVSQPVTVQGTMGKRELRGKVNGGGVQVEVETGSGNIEIQ